MINISNYKYKDIGAIISRFKSLLEPKGGNHFKDYSELDQSEFELLIDWLSNHDYYIEEFPNVIKNKASLNDFGSNMIKERIRQESGENGSISWASRRELISKLHIYPSNVLPAFEISDDLNYQIKSIATSDSNFYEMSLDEQLMNLCNFVENQLFEDGKYKSVNTTDYYDFFDDTTIKKYRNDTQAFRHAKGSTLEERRSWSESKKLFYIRLGILIVTNFEPESNLPF